MRKYNFEAVIFDLDGVVTKTAHVHSKSFERILNSFLHQQSEKDGKSYKPYSFETDYLKYIDGKPRPLAIELFLQSRGVTLEKGEADDAPSNKTIHGLANKKDEIFNNLLAKHGVQTYSSTMELIKKLKTAGVKVGIASSSKNCQSILEIAGLIDYFDARVDGVVLDVLNLNVKPNPDIFTTAADHLGVSYGRCVVVEDAATGIQAAAHGDFGLIIGIARHDNTQQLKASGANIVVDDLGSLGGIQAINEWFEVGMKKDEWELNYYDYDIKKERSREALLAVGNGYFGTRGAMEETDAGPTNYPGTYIAGLYNRLDSDVAGRTITNEDFVNCPNWLPITFKIGNSDWFDFNKTKFYSIQKKLCLKTGVFSRILEIEDEQGRQTRIESQRTASMYNPHLAALQYCITPLNYNEDITVKSGINGKQINAGVERYKQLNQNHTVSHKQGGENNISYVTIKTVQSDIEIAEVAKLVVYHDENKKEPEMQVDASEAQAYTTFTIAVKQDQKLELHKMVSIYTSQDKDISNPLAFAQNDVATLNHFDEVFSYSRKKWEALWNETDIRIECDRMSQKLIRLHLYHLLVTASQHHVDIDAGIPARGLHGEAYRGHIFWDELYILPFYYMHLSDTAKSVLMYRYRRLDKAREYSKDYGYKGAMFPWQSGSDGTEETQIIHLNPRSGKWDDDYSSLQRHISIAVAYNVWKYYQFTNDIQFLENYGAEMFLEICRFWASKATYNDKTGRYEINKVMGPDEFHEKYPDVDYGGLNNNAYTNIMVAYLFKKAFEMLNIFDVTAKNKVLQKIKLKPEELERWHNISQRLYLEISDKGIISQFQGYFDLEELNWDAYREKYKNIHRMDRILKAEGKSPDAYKVAKQADLLMTFYNLDRDEVSEILNDFGCQLPDNYLKANYNYYLKRTSHGSTLSRVVHAYLASIIGNKKHSWKLYKEALASDYVDIQGGTTGEGIHAGVMGGTILAVIFTYGGINLRSDVVKINPDLPRVWEYIEFKFNYKQKKYAVKISNETIDIKVLCDDEETPVIINEKKYVLKPQQWYHINIV